MKAYILTISFALIAAVSVGQSRTFRIGLEEADSAGYKITKIYRYDTTRVMMLLCDTGYRLQTDTKSAGVIDTTFYQQPKEKVWWAWGYKIATMKLQTVVNEEKMVAYYDTEFIEVAAEYLDKDKKPLRNTIVVWMTK
jgi:hypothetical protein